MNNIEQGRIIHRWDWASALGQNPIGRHQMIKIMTRPLKYFYIVVLYIFCWKRCRCIENARIRTAHIQNQITLDRQHHLSGCAKHKLKKRKYHDIYSGLYSESEKYCVRLSKHTRSAYLCLRWVSPQASGPSAADGSGLSGKSPACNSLTITGPIVFCYLESFKDFYLRFWAALSTVSQTYVDSLNAMLIRIHSLLKILVHCWVMQV